MAKQHPETQVQMSAPSTTVGPTLPPAPLPAPSAGLEDVVRSMATSVAALTASVAQLAQAQGQQARHHTQLTEALAGVVGDREAVLRRDRDELAAQERIRRETAKTCQQRTQELADQLWPASAPRYTVALLVQRKVVNEMTGKSRLVMVPDGAFPVIQIGAGSPEEADGRYRKLCGIVSTEGQIRAVPAGEKLAAPVGISGETDERLPAGVEAFA